MWSREMAASPRSSLWAVVVLALVICVSFANAQTCNTLIESYELTGSVSFAPANSTIAAYCIRLLPQPSNRAREAKFVNLTISSDYDIGANSLIYYTTWLPIDKEYYIAYDAGECCDDPTQIVRSPIVLIVFNSTDLQWNPFTIKWAASTETKTKFAMGLFQGLIVAFGLPILTLTFSLCTFRRGICNEAGKTRRLSRKSPMAEKIATFIACGIGMLFFFLLTFRVFG